MSIPCTNEDGRKSLVIGRAYGDEPIKLIGVPVAGPRNEDARQTAGALAERLGAKLEESPAEPVDLLVVGSQPAAPAGRVVVGGDVRAELDRARSSVLVVPAGAPLLP